MMPPYPSKCSVFNLNLEQKPHPKLKMNFSSGVSLKCSLFKSQCAHERKDKDDWVVVLPRKESIKPLKILPDRDRAPQRLVGSIIFIKILLMCVTSYKAYHTIGFKLFSLFL